ncbi:hypothetical protein F5887DRAFT_1287342 [Amanita rubescens]|nr:hypothetical protein F5887DRAFT_1287342 [Amanita rubescens]
MSTLYINCFLPGTDSSQVFTVEVLETDNVSILKKLIKEKQSHRLNHVHASELILSQVSLPVDDDFEESLKNVDLTPLKPFLLLSQVFPHVKWDHLHIIVQAPNDAGEEERRDRIPALRKRFQNVFLKAGASADSAKSSNYTKSQIAYSIYDGRYKANKPRTSVAPPVQLFHPAFGHFLDDMKSNHALPGDLIRQTIEYMKAATAIYASEEKRREELTPLLSDILDVNFAEVMKNTLHFMIFLQEDKNEFGYGGSDPSTRAGLSAIRYWAQPRCKALRNATVCPTFLLATAGPWIAILGAVITDGVIVQRLTDYIWVGLDSALSESHIAQVARAFYALKASREKLISCYENLDPMGDLPADSRYFPSITAYRPHGGGHVKFKYVGFLENCPDCITLHARTETMPAQDIVVKFVDRYGRKAHQILADQGVAPKLLYCGSPRLNDDEPSYQSISMVVMEYIDGDMFTVTKKKMSEESVETVRSTVRRALELLHSRGFVFGDLRPPNVMITKDGEVKLIDFNWAGEEGQAKYPLLISSEIAWPEGVKALAVMRREYDLDMLRKFF